MSQQQQEPLLVNGSVAASLNNDKTLLRTAQWLWVGAIIVALANMIVGLACPLTFHPASYRFEVAVNLTNTVWSLAVCGVMLGLHCCLERQEGARQKQLVTGFSGVFLVFALLLLVWNIWQLAVWDPVSNAAAWCFGSTQSLPSTLLNLLYHLIRIAACATSLFFTCEMKTKPDDDFVTTLYAGQPQYQQPIQPIHPTQVTVVQV